MAILGADFHFLERVAKVRVTLVIQADGSRVVWIDGHKGDTLVLVD
jgi:hypothetical protein